jgi:hypothetical protein
MERTVSAMEETQAWGFTSFSGTGERLQIKMPTAAQSS